MIELLDNTRRMGDVELADQLIVKVLPTLARFPDDLALQARQHEARGWLAKEKGDLPTAAIQMLSAVANARGAYHVADTGMADALRGLAAIEAASKNYDGARQHAAEAMQVASAASNASPTDKIGAELDQARIEFAAGQFGQALPAMSDIVERCDNSLGSTNESCTAMRVQRVLLLIKTGSASDVLRDLPIFQHDAQNDLSPQRQIEAKIMIVRILAANSMWADADLLAAQLELLTRGARDETVSDSLLLATYFAIAELQIREGRGFAASDGLNRMDAQVDLSNSEPGYKARALMLRGLAKQSERDFTGALRSLEDAERAYASSYGTDHTQTLLCRLNQIYSLTSLGRVYQAAGLIDATMPLLEKRLPLHAPLIAQIHLIRNKLAIRSQIAVPSTLFFN